MQTQIAAQKLALYKELLSLPDAVKLAERDGKELGSNLSADMMLSEGAFGGKMLRTGTTLIYPPINQPFEDNVKNDSGLTFTVPDIYRGKEGIALAIQHPNYTISGVALVVDEPTIHEIKFFPVHNGWYCMDDETGIPAGPAIEGLNDTDPSARYLLRAQEGGIRNAVRDARGIVNRKFVYLDFPALQPMQTVYAVG